MSEKDKSQSGAKTLSDADIATYARRGGPAHGAGHSDSDAVSDSDQHAPTDVDYDKASAKDGHSDKDS